MALDFPAHIPFVEHLGLELIHCDQGEAEILLTPQAHMLNSFQVLHGGVTMTLLDVAMAHAARSVNPGGLPGTVTVEMKTTFMQAASGPVRARAKLLHRSATLAFTEGSLFNAQGLQLAHASGTFKYMRALPAPRR
jgi:uncharacterized protein (TIGR00369 family)